MRILICDDEPLACERLADLLSLCEDAELVGTAANGQEALDAIERLRPDLLLIDIEMPRFDGFDVVEELSRAPARADAPPPLIIFVTAYPRFAADAFEAAALDFLTKPVRHARLERALGRARDALAAREAAARLDELAGQLATLRQEHRGPREQRHLWVQRRGEMVRVPLDDLDFVAAEGEYIRLHLKEQSYLHRDLLSAMMTQLDPDRFVRIHRSYAVNRERVASIRRSVHGGWKLLLATGVEIPVGRTYRQAARAALLEPDRDAG